MTQHAHLDPGPFFLDGGSTGVLLIHGFTGAPPEMRLLGDYLHARGYTVSGPLLPGHGTRPQDIFTLRWSDWTGYAEAALADLKTRCQKVFVGGLSLGALISLYLAEQEPGLSGVMAYSPATRLADWRVALTPVMKRFVRLVPAPGGSDLTDPTANARIWCYEQVPVSGVAEVAELARRVRGLLPRLRTPLLVVYSTGDRSLHPEAGRQTYERAGSPQKELVTLTGSGHCITADGEWPLVAERTAEFIEKHGG